MADAEDLKSSDSNVLWVQVPPALLRGVFLFKRLLPGMAKAYENAEEAWDEYRGSRQEVIRTANAIDAGDPMHPLATNDFPRQ